MIGPIIRAGTHDVQDQESLRAFRSKRAKWIGWLSTDPDNDIWTQLSKMTWNDAVFRLINEGRRLTTRSEQQCAIQNRLLDGFAVEGYLATQVLTVRRLTDRSKHTISLNRLADDIKRNRHLLTRENYVAYDGVPYDYGPVQQEAMFRDLTRTEDDDPAIKHSPASDWISSVTRHKMFDRIAKKDKSTRRRTDLIDETVLEDVHSMTRKESFQDLVELADNFLAHAGATFRRDRSRKDIKITLDLIADAHRKLLTACHIISTAILNYADRNFLPIAQYNKFENLDKPWIPGDSLERLDEWWKAHERKLICWRQHALDEVL